MKKAKWSQVSTVLKSLQEQDVEPEKIRLAILSYCAAVLMNKEEPQAFLTMDSFKEPFYNTGRAGLVRACYEALFK
jgi:hypothetical protein